MKRRMKQKKYGILIVVGIVMMVLVPFAPCRAGWSYIDSYYSTGPTSGSDSDAYCSWSFSVTDISRSANSSGVSTSATCEAESEVFITATTGQSISRNPVAICGTYCQSRYADPEVEEDLYVDWEVDDSGTVEVSGLAYDWYVVTGSLYVFSAAIAGIDSHEDGSGYATGSATPIGCLIEPFIWPGRRPCSSKDYEVSTADSPRFRAGSC